MPIERPVVTRAGFLAGARLALPLLPGLSVFGAAYGAAAAQKGFDLWQAGVTSAVVYAGASQMVALEMWRRPLDLASLAGIVAVTLFVNARMTLMGATIQPWLHGLPRAQTAFQLFFLTDVNWLIGMRHRAEGGRDLGVLFGAGIALWPLWVAATLVGHLAGGLIERPRAIGLDFILPALFAATLVPLWRGPRPALPWLVSALTALAVQRLVDGYAFIVVGALAGVAVGAFIDDGQEAVAATDGRGPVTAYLDGLLAGPAGPALAIVAMGLTTYACRVSGVAVMSRVRVTPRVARALRALPGSIIVATAVPVGVSAGPVGVAGLLAAAVTMKLTHFELAAILAGVGTVAAGRALGF